MTKVFIFNNASRAAGYGIGTYVRQLAESLTHKEGYDVSVIEMRADIKDFEIENDAAGIRRYRIPSITSGSEGESYFRSVYYYLVRHMDIDGGDRVAFHFNYYYHLPSHCCSRAPFRTAASYSQYIISTGASSFRETSQDSGRSSSPGKTCLTVWNSDQRKRKSGSCESMEVGM